MCIRDRRGVGRVTQLEVRQWIEALLARDVLEHDIRDTPLERHREGLALDVRETRCTGVCGNKVGDVPHRYVQQTESQSLVVEHGGGIRRHGDKSTLLRRHDGLELVGVLPDY